MTDFVEYISDDDLKEINLSDYLKAGDLFDDQLVYTAYVRSRQETDYSKPDILLTIITFSDRFDNTLNLPLLEEKIIRRELSYGTDPVLTLELLKSMLETYTVKRPQYINPLQEF